MRARRVALFTLPFALRSVSCPLELCVLYCQCYRFESGYDQPAVWYHGVTGTIGRIFRHVGNSRPGRRSYRHTLESSDITKG